jgi:hypothetical protein
LTRSSPEHFIAIDVVGELERLAEDDRLALAVDELLPRLVLQLDELAAEAATKMRNVPMSRIGSAQTPRCRGLVDAGAQLAPALVGGHEQVVALAVADRVEDLLRQVPPDRMVLPSSVSRSNCGMKTCVSSPSFVTV